MKTTFNWREKFIKQFSEQRMGGKLGPIIEDAQSLLDFITTLISETEKAFGGCKKCYGKGYATTLQFAESAEDFGGEITERRKLPLIRFCSCERGKQLKTLLKDYKQE